MLGLQVLKNKVNGESEKGVKGGEGREETWESEEDKGGGGIDEEELLKEIQKAVENEEGQGREGREGEKVEKVTEEKGLAQEEVKEEEKVEEEEMEEGEEKRDELAVLYMQGDKAVLRFTEIFGVNEPFWALTQRKAPRVRRVFATGIP